MHKLTEIIGVDASGKSTLGQALARIFSGHYYYSPPKHMQAERETIRGTDPETQFAFYSKANHVVTEAAKESLATGPVFAEPYVHSTVANYQVNSGEPKDVPKDILFPDRRIYLRPTNWDAIQERLIARGEDIKPHENIPYLRELAQVYDQLLTGGKKILEIDSTTTTFEESLAITCEWLRG